MFSTGHINIGTSTDDVYFKSRNQNNLFNKYNKFLVNPYLPRLYNHSFGNKNNKGYNDSKDSDDSLGETHIFYPKPNNYNNIYTQRYSKKYKDYYNTSNNVNKSCNVKVNNYLDNYSSSKDKNNQIDIIKYPKIPNNQIKHEIQFQKIGQYPYKNNNLNFLKYNHNGSNSYNDINSYRNSNNNLLNKNIYNEINRISYFNCKQNFNYNKYFDFHNQRTIEQEEQRRRRRLFYLRNKF